MGCIMGLITLPFRIYEIITGIVEWIEKVDDETMIISKTYGAETASKYKRRQYIGCLIQNLIYLALLFILGFIIKLIFL